MSAHTSDLDAERAVLGSMMVSEDAAIAVYDIISEADVFYAPAHGFIFNALRKLMLDASPTDPVTVADRLAREGLLENAGGATYLHRLMQDAFPASATYHAKLVLDAHRRRKATAAAIKAHQKVTNPEVDLGQAIAESVADLHACIGVTNERTGPVDLRAEAGQRIAEWFDPDAYPVEPGIRVGLIDFDRLTGGGLRRGQLVIVAGRPGMGKSLMLTQIARHAAVREKANVLMFSLEMRQEEVTARIFSAEAKVALHALVSRQTLEEHERLRLESAAGRIRDGASLAICDDTTVDIGRIRSIARMHQLRHGLDILIVDYLQLITPTSTREQRSQQLDAITRGLKVLAGELDVVVIAASQLNRGPEQRTDKRPQLSDLRESGSIENDANIVILMHRDDYYDKESPRAGELDLIVAKNRNGPTDTITTAAQFHIARIADMAIG